MNKFKNKRTVIILGIIFISVIAFVTTFVALRFKNVPNETSSVDTKAYAYMVAFEDMYQKNTNLLTGNIKIMGVDLSKTLLENKNDVVKLLEDFCKSKNYQPVTGTHDELINMGYIKDTAFENGFLLIFEDKKLNNNTLNTEVTIWRGGLAAVGTEYTLKYQNDAWNVTKTEGYWVS